jgi:hypothetical protein
MDNRYPSSHDTNVVSTENYQQPWQTGRQAAASEETARVDHSIDAKTHLIQDAVAPLDSYTQDGVYWADLPFLERVCGLARTYYQVLLKYFN